MELNEENKKNITIGDIADELGISKTTVSRAISGKGRIGDSTREKVMEYIKKYDYKPNIIAKGLAQSRTYNICVTIPSDYNGTDFPFFQEILVGICEFLSARDYDVVLTSISDNNIANLVRIVSNRKVDGVLLTRTVIDSKAVEYLKSKKIPFVTLGTYPDKEVIQIDSDHRGGCKELTSILLMKGLKKIVLFGGDNTHFVTQSRYKGFVEALEVNGIPLGKNHVFENLISNIEIEKAVDDALKHKTECIVCMDDNICRCVLRKLSRENVQVPKDIKVASFFGSSLLEGRTPSVTCLKFDTKELGVLSGKAILELLSDKKISQKTLLGYEVILKESTK